jgi:hypothetical protein
MVGCPHNVHYNLPRDPMMTIEPAHHTAMPPPYQERRQNKGNDPPEESQAGRELGEGTHDQTRVLNFLTPY